MESDFPNAPVSGTWYHVALANKLAYRPIPAGARRSERRRCRHPGALQLAPGPVLQLSAGSPFYLGLDGNHGTAIDLVEVLLHEFAHGLGFSTVTSGSNGTYLAGQPSIYDHFAFDNTAAKTWVQMTDAERMASAINPRNWSGSAPTSPPQRHWC